MGRFSIKEREDLSQGGACEWIHPDPTEDRCQLWLHQGVMGPEAVAEELDSSPDPGVRGSLGGYLLPNQTRAIYSFT